MKTRQYIQLDRPVVDNLLTTGDAYVIVPFNIDRTEETRNYWDAWHLTGVKVLLFSATTKDLKVKILGSLDGTTFSQTVEAEFTVTTSAIVEKRITAYWPYLQIQVKPAAAGQNGTLSVQAMGTTISSEVDTELTATIDPAGLATELTLEDIKTATEALAVATPDTAAGDLASMSADLGTIQADIATVKADIATVASNSEITPATVTGTCTAAYVTALSIACAGVRNKTIVVVNTDAALTMKYRVRGFAKSGSSYYNEIQAEATLAASTSQPHVIENSYDVITVEVIDGTGHATYAIDYCGGQ